MNKQYNHHTLKLALKATSELKATSVNKNQCLRNLQASIRTNHRMKKVTCWQSQFLAFPWLAGLIVQIFYFLENTLRLAIFPNGILLMEN